MYGRGAYDMKGSLAAIMLVAAAATDLRPLGRSDRHRGRRRRGAEHRLRANRGDRDRRRRDRHGADRPRRRRRAPRLRVARPRDAAGARRTAPATTSESMPSPAWAAPLVAIDELDKRLRDEGEIHPLLGGASLHASLIEGGTELSTYPDRCVVKVERRTLPGEIGRLRGGAAPRGGAGRDRHLDLLTRAARDASPTLRSSTCSRGRPSEVLGHVAGADRCPVLDGRRAVRGRWHSDGRVRAGRRGSACRRRVGRPERRRAPRGDPPGDGPTSSACSGAADPAGASSGRPLRVRRRRRAVAEARGRPRARGIQVAEHAPGRHGACSSGPQGSRHVVDRQPWRCRRVGLQAARREGDRVRAAGGKRAQARPPREPRQPTARRRARSRRGQGRGASVRERGGLALLRRRGGASPVRRVRSDRGRDRRPVPVPSGSRGHADRQRGARGRSRRGDRKAGTSDRSGGSRHRADAGDGCELRRGSGRRRSRGHDGRRWARACASRSPSPSSA